MQLPIYVGPHGAGSRSDRLRRRGTVAADGTCQVVVGAPAGGEYWYLTRVVVQAPSAAVGACKAYLYIGTVQPSDLEDVSYDASFDVDDDTTPILVDNADLIIVFTGAPPASNVYVSAQITRVRA
jgi:hypothetical protein